MRETKIRTASKKISPKYLRELGMENASYKLSSIIAEKFYKEVDLDNGTHKLNIDGKKYHVRIIKLDYYEHVPPSFVLDELDKAIKKGIFNKFLICDIRKKDDPFLIGCIKELNYYEGYRYFLITQWEVDFL